MNWKKYYILRFISLYSIIITLYFLTIFSSMFTYLLSQWVINRQPLLFIIPFLIVTAILSVAAFIYSLIKMKNV